MNEEYALLVQRPQFRGDDGPINGPSDDTGIRRRPLHPHVPSAGELRDPDVGSSTIVTPRSSKHLPKRIGWGLWLSILVSFIILVAAVAFLSWLWFKDRQDETWRRVMLSGWSTQAITLTGVLIRFAIGSLGAISTSMIASIAAERHGLPKSAIVEVSIARFTNDGPQSFWKHILSGATFKPWMRGIIAVLLLFEVAAQFTSTILLTDLRASHVGSFDQDISHRFTYDLLNTSLNEPLPLESFTHNYWVQKPSSSEIFAEYWKPGKTGEGIDDTGATIIGFLPLAVQSAREALSLAADRNVNPFEIPQNLLSQVFTDVLNTTDSPALAIQALKTLLYRLIYYDHISTFTLAPDNATITTFELVRTPNGRWGLIAVLSIIFGNVLLFVIVTLLFLEVTSYSFIQNAWHAVAQVSQSEEAWLLLETATLASDKDMEYWIHGREPPEGIVANVKDFFLDIGRLFQTRETRDSEKLYVKSGAPSGRKAKKKATVLALGYDAMMCWKCVLYYS
ncbi:hypothetical protein CDV36_001003 [Fusarium kuroshium]|uniref:Uncharacterized protein n=1 Tax=Fusarium kuroshium TaxID=2010991 RepID=A0A3M2SP43_9HYPO|nr:hypothetical protein CDV36_001003 [Fusarium kuroshium]